MTYILNASKDNSMNYVIQRDNKYLIYLNMIYTPEFKHKINLEIP